MLIMRIDKPFIGSGVTYQVTTAGPGSNILHEFTYIYIYFNRHNNNNWGLNVVL